MFGYFDGDVVVYVIVDVFFGVVGFGDIGEYFGMVYFEYVGVYVEVFLVCMCEFFVVVGFVIGNVLV